MILYFQLALHTLTVLQELRTGWHPTLPNGLHVRHMASVLIEQYLLTLPHLPETLLRQHIHMNGNPLRKQTSNSNVTSF